MKYNEIKFSLSKNLDLPVTEINRLVNTNRIVIRELIKKHSCFTIPCLGHFNINLLSELKEYSHYHGYRIPVKLNHSLIFTPFSENYNTREAITDIAFSISRKTGITYELSQMFITEAAKNINTGLERDGMAFFSGIGMFKLGSIQKNKIFFKADAGIRNYISKFYNPVQLKATNDSMKNETEQSILPKNPHETNEVQSSITALHDTITNITEKAPVTAVPTGNTVPQPEILPVSNSTELLLSAGGGSPGSSSGSESSSGQMSQSTITKQNKPFKPVESDARSAKMKKLTRESFSNEHEELSYREKHPYFEWIVIAIFLTILAIGLYIIKPSDSSKQEFNTTPFEFTKIEKQPVTEDSKPDKSSTPPSNEEASITKNSKASQKTSELTTKETNATITQPLPIKGMPVLQTYIVKKGDTLWDISIKLYSTPYFWPAIFSKNSNLLTNPDLIEPGMTLVLPVFQSTFTDLSIDDKPQIVKSYYQVYKAYKNSGKNNSDEFLNFSESL